MGPAKRESPTSHSSAVLSSEPRIISLHLPTVNLFSGMKRIKMDLCFCRKKQAYFCNKPRSALVMNPLDACPQTLRCLIGREVCTGGFLWKVNSPKGLSHISHIFLLFICPLSDSLFTVKSILNIYLYLYYSLTRNYYLSLNKISHRRYLFTQSEGSCNLCNKLQLIRFMIKI